MVVWVLCVEAFIDISRWWPKNKDGKLVSVYEVYQRFEGGANQVNRHTLSVARDGKLAKADIANLVKLARICSELAGEKILIDDLVKVEDNK